MIMLRFNFTRVFKARGVDRPFTYLKKAGYSASFATRVSNNKVEGMNLKHVERLCILFQCTPNDLLEWIPDRKDPIGDKQTLATLSRNEKTVQLIQMINSITLDRLNAIEAVIKKETGE
jgi:DNA-binding Xre family transcriptional regulator